ncbi:hypothetical protein Gpo141_00012443 [Globisporangium polare]
MGTLLTAPTADGAQHVDGSSSTDEGEKAALVQHIAELEAQVQLLKQQQQIADPRENFPLVHKSFANKSLREALQSYRYSLADVQSAVAGMVSANDELPCEPTIRLGRDWQDRGRTLQDLKDAKIRDSVRYIQQRSRFIDPMAEVSENSRFMSANGDYCVLRISEVLGDITIRDDDTTRGHGVSHHRLISNLECGDVQIEVNCVRFAAFFPKSVEFGNGRDFGVIAFDFVDSDELFPYAPLERVREDVTGVLTVKSETRRRVNGEEEEVVVLSRTCLLKLHRPQLAIPESVLDDLHESLGSWGDVMLKKVKELLRLRTTTPTPPPPSE